jgi:hypothetical protein
MVVPVVPSHAVGRNTPDGSTRECVVASAIDPQGKEQYDMKRLNIAGLCLVSMLVMGMALAGNASAAPLWLLCLPNAKGKFLDPACLKAGEGKWESESLGTRTDKVVGVGFTIRMEDAKTSVGKTVVQCGHGVGAGTIGPGNKALMTEVKIQAPKTECEAVEGGCKKGEVEKIEGRNLPWQVEIFETEKKFLTKIESTTSGKEPGWAMECNTLLGSKTDVCEQEAGKPEFAELANKRSGPKEEELLVLGTFEKKRHQDCSEGGVESGSVAGQIAILLAKANANEPNGLGLSLNGV